MFFKLGEIWFVVSQIRESIRITQKARGNVGVYPIPPAQFFSRSGVGLENQFLAHCTWMQVFRLT